MVRSGAPEDVGVAVERETQRSGLSEWQIAEERFARAESTARLTQYQAYAMLGFLLSSAGLAFAGGTVAHSMVFWGAAGAVFLLAMSAVIVYIAQRLGIVVDLIRTLKTLDVYRSK